MNIMFVKGIIHNIYSNTYYFTKRYPKIANYLSKGEVTKTAFRDTLNFIVNENLYKKQDCVRRDYNTLF